MDWFRWWHGTVNDPKFQLIARRSKTSTANVLAIWACLLEAASSVTPCDATKQRGDAGSFSCDAYDVLLGLDDGVCRSVVDQFEVAGMVKDGAITAWEKRQPKKEDSSAKRTREYRDRKKQKQTAPSATVCDDIVTPCDAPEKIREEKRIKEKAIRISDESAEEDFYLTKKKKKLTGKRLETFLQFWEAFDYKRDKAPAADAWLAIPQLTERLVAEIVKAAKRAASERSGLIADGKTPKMAEGWLSNRRWEDEDAAEAPAAQPEKPRTCKTCCIPESCTEETRESKKGRGCSSWTDE